VPGAVEPAQSEKIVNNSNVSRPGAVQFNRLRRFGWLHVFVFAVSPWRALPESFCTGAGVRWHHPVEKALTDRTALSTAARRAVAT